MITNLLHSEFLNNGHTGTQRAEKKYTTNKRSKLTCTIV